jgi:hypothetical protein
MGGYRKYREYKGYRGYKAYRDYRGKRERKGERSNRVTSDDFRRADRLPLCLDCCFHCYQGKSASAEATLCQ